MKNKYIKIRNKGFSLLEVVFAFAILEFVMLALIGSFPAIARLNKNAKFMSYANQYAQEKMEEIIAGQYVISPGKIPYNFNDDNCVTYAKNTWGQYDELPDPEMSGETNPPKIFKRIWWAEDIEVLGGKDTGNSALQMVNVRVLWQEGTRQRSLDLNCQCLLIYRERSKDETKPKN